jgi:hypothetical protein
MKNVKIGHIRREDEKDRILSELSVKSHKKRRNREFYLNLILCLAMIVASLQALILFGRKAIDSILRYLKSKLSRFV